MPRVGLDPSLPVIPPYVTTRLSIPILGMDDRDDDPVLLRRMFRHAWILNDIRSISSVRETLARGIRGISTSESGKLERE